jgi:hypothetical protein
MSAISRWVRSSEQTSDARYTAAAAKPVGDLPAWRPGSVAPSTISAAFRWVSSSRSSSLENRGMHCPGSTGFSDRASSSLTYR